MSKSAASFAAGPLSSHAHASALAAALQNRQKTATEVELESQLSMLYAMGVGMERDARRYGALLYFFRECSPQESAKNR